MNKKIYVVTSLLLMFCGVFFSCKSNRSNVYGYFESKFNFVENSSPKYIFIYKTPGCSLCNQKMLEDIEKLTLKDNFYLLLISHYPYSEMENKNTLFLKKKFKDHFAIEKTDDYQKVNLKLKRSGILKIDKRQITKKLDYSDEKVEIESIL
ncbi:MAG: hypothetical protein RR356_00900 [Bacteroidales bacterium]